MIITFEQEQSKIKLSKFAFQIHNKYFKEVSSYSDSGLQGQLRSISQTILTACKGI